MSIKIAIMVSGRGSNMAAILRAIDEGKLNAKVPIVLSNNPDAPALRIAEEYGISSVAVSHKGLSRAEHESSLLATLSSYSLDYVVLAGYMRVLGQLFLSAFKDKDGYYRVTNIHPSLLPAFPGSSAYEDAFSWGVKLSGVTVHLVDEKVDHGPILAQESFPRFDDDTLSSFKARGLELEHKLYPAVLQRIATEGIKLLPSVLVQHVSEEVQAK